MRQKIGKALKARSEAIKKALQTYNKLASTLTPPREQLSWATVIEMASVGELDLLRYARQDIRDLPWTQKPAREAMRHYANLNRAREEIARLNVEIRRVLTAMCDEHTDYYRVISSNLMCNPPLARELSQRWQYRQLINTRIALQLVKTSHLPGFTGSIAIGRRMGRSYGDNTSIPPPFWIGQLGLSFARIDDENDDGVEEFLEQEIDDLVTFMDNIDISD